MTVSAKSEFKSLELRDGKLTASGITTLPDRDDAGLALPTTRVHVVLVQGNRVVFAQAGEAPGPPHPTWDVNGDVMNLDASQPVQAFGLAVEFTDVSDGAAFTTFAWTQTLPVQMAPA
jgi:hypothetical protein